jgi:hypothetical protein
VLEDAGWLDPKAKEEWKKAFAAEPVKKTKRHPWRRAAARTSA